MKGSSIEFQMMEPPLEFKKIDPDENGASKKPPSAADLPVIAEIGVLGPEWDCWLEPGGPIAERRRAANVQPPALSAHAVSSEPAATPPGQLRSFREGAVLGGSARTLESDVVDAWPSAVARSLEALA